MDHGIFDFGMTWHFLLLNASVIDIWSATNPLGITLLDSCSIVWDNHPQHVHVIFIPQQNWRNNIGWPFWKKNTIHTETGETKTSYEKLVIDLLTKETRTKATTMELGNIAQGHKVTNTSGTKKLFFLFPW